MLTLQFVPYLEIESLGSARRVKTLIDLVKDDKIVLLGGRLKPVEETDLIAVAMEEIDEKFRGIELAVIEHAKKESSFFKAVKEHIVNVLLGDRQGFTIIGPASIVKEIKKDPNKIQLYTRDNVSNGRKKKADKAG